MVYGSAEPKLEEWIYFSPAKYVYFYKEDGSLWKEEPFTELDRLSIKEKVKKGMNGVQVRRSKGEPWRITIEFSGSRKGQEKWAYGDMYVWFEGGEVVHVQK